MDSFIAARIWPIQKLVTTLSTHPDPFALAVSGDVGIRWRLVRL